MNPTVNSKSIGEKGKATLSSSSSNEPSGGSNSGENKSSANSYNDNNGKVHSYYCSIFKKIVFFSDVYLLANSLTSLFAHSFTD